MFRKQIVLVSLMTSCLFAAPQPAQAGCGCTKPPPELASVRPNATYAGTELTLFHASLQDGQDYSVTLTSGTQPGQSASVTVQAVTRRDLADAQDKPQLVVALPNLPLGPTSISVADQNGPVFSLADAAFTVAPQPITFPEEVGEVTLADYQAAVSRNGVVYISLNVTDLHMPRTFHAQALGYPLRFTNDEVVFYNTQGFMMQLLDEGMPGLFAIDTSTGSPDSDTLQYSRHEFNTHFLQHEERQSHAVDASDPNWHADGTTPHIDHDHLIVAISGMLADGSQPEAGATPAFELALDTLSFFQHGLVGDTRVEMNAKAKVDSYDPQTETYGTEGDVRSNGAVVLLKDAQVKGDATAFAFDISGNAEVTENITLASEPLAFLAVDMPSALEDLGSLVVDKGDTRTLKTGSYHAATVSVKGTLFIENTAGPVTLYVTGPMQVNSAGTVSVADPDPEKFALYMASPDEVKLSGKGDFYGVVYAPESSIKISGQGKLFGSFVGHDVRMTGKAAVHYDTALRGE